LDARRNCAVIIPCFNEETEIEGVVAAVKRFVPLVIVVDDGSKDQTAARAEASGALVVNHTRNCGKGVALRTGLETARKLGVAWAFTLDGDGQHAAEDIPAFFRCAQNRHPALTVGSRMHAAHRIPLIRRWVNRWMTTRISRLVDVPFADTQCGFRLIFLEAWARLPLRTEHFETESELLVEMVRSGYRVEFVPIQVIYNKCASKLHPVRDTLRWLRWWQSQLRESGRRAKVEAQFISAPAG